MRLGSFSGRDGQENGLILGDKNNVTELWKALVCTLLLLGLETAMCTEYSYRLVSKED